MATEFNRAVARFIATCALCRLTLSCSRPRHQVAACAVAIQQLPAPYDPPPYGFSSSSNRTPAYPPSLSLTSLFSFSLKQNASLGHAKARPWLASGLGAMLAVLAWHHPKRILVAHAAKLSSNCNYTPLWTEAQSRPQSSLTICLELTKLLSFVILLGLDISCRQCPELSS